MICCSIVIMSTTIAIAQNQTKKVLRPVVLLKFKQTVLSKNIQEVVEVAFKNYLSN